MSAAAAKKTPLSSTSSTSSLSSPQPHHRVFISLRFSESMTEAAAIKTQLEAKGISTFLCNELPGSDLASTIINALEKCELVLIMGSQTYGFNTGAGFSTFEELRFIIQEKKPYFLVKMCARFEVAETRFRLTDDLMYFKWLPGTPMPDTLIAQIVEKLNTVSAPSTPLASAGASSSALPHSASAGVGSGPASGAAASGKAPSASASVGMEPSEAAKLIAEVSNKDKYPRGSGLPQKQLQGLGISYEEGARRLAVQDIGSWKSVGFFGLARCLPKDERLGDGPGTLMAVHDGRRLSYLQLLAEALRHDQNNKPALDNMDVYFDNIIKELVNKDAHKPAQCAEDILVDGSITITKHAHALVPKAAKSSVVCDLCGARGTPIRLGCSASCNFDACGKCAKAHASNPSAVLTYKSVSVLMVQQQASKVVSFGLLALSRCLGSDTKENMEVVLCGGEKKSMSYEQLLIRSIEVHPTNIVARCNLRLHYESLVQRMQDRDAFPFGKCRDKMVTKELSYKGAAEKLIGLPDNELQSFGCFALSRCIQGKSDKDTIKHPDGRLMREKDLLREALRLDPTNKSAKHNLEVEEDCCIV